MGKPQGGADVSRLVRGSGFLVDSGSMAHTKSSSKKDSLFLRVRAGEGLWPSSEEELCILATQGCKTKAE